MDDYEKLLLDMLKSGPQTAKQIVEANTGKSGIKRRAFLVVEKRAQAFSGGIEQKTWVAMPGLRGTGKSTLLAQMYSHPSLKNCKKIFASLDRVKTIGANIQDFIQACEKFIGEPFENCNEPIALFLDEVQYLDNWAVGLKTVIDRSKRIFVYCTGSSALSLQTNPDVARRIDMIKLHPLCFTEYVMIKQAHKSQTITVPVKGLAQQIREATFYSHSADEAYNQLKKKESNVSLYWRRTGYEKPELFSEFLKYGTLPFTLTLPNEAAIWERINRILSESLDRDATSLGRFESETVSSLPRLLFLLASSVEISMNSIAIALLMNQRTVDSVLSALEKTEIITAIPPKGTHNGHIRKASKYLFTSPAMRAALCNFGGIITPENSDSLKGKLLEDLVGMYLKRLFLDAPLTRAIVEYDTAKGGADFIISPDGRKPNSIAVEVGANKTKATQVIQTLSELDGKYGIIITGGSLEVDRINNVLKLPFEFFLLI